MDVIRHPNLSLWLPLWRKDGGAFMSADAYGRLCTVTGAVWRKVEITGLNFDGTNDLISVATDPIGTNPLTIAMTIRPTGLGDSGLGMPINNGQFFMGLQTAAPDTSFIVTSDGNTTRATSATGAIQFNQVYRIVIARDGAGVANLFVNGKLSGTANQATGAPVAGTATLTVGNLAAGNRAFAGIIGEVALYVGPVWGMARVARDYAEFQRRHFR